MLAILKMHNFQINFVYLGFRAVKLVNPLIASWSILRKVEVKIRVTVEPACGTWMIKALILLLGVFRPSHIPRLWLLLLVSA
jgi:hypothetical protein